VTGAGFVFLKKNFLYFLVKLLYRLSSKSATATWFINSDDLEWFINSGIVDRQKTRILPGEGIDTNRFKRSSPYGIAGPQFTFLFSGRLLWAKGVGYYVQAARRLAAEYKHVRFSIIGFLDKEGQDAVSEDELAQWNKEGVVTHLGALSDVKAFLDTVDCLVFPSFYREGIPKVLLEAASMEIPIITTENVGCREVVEHNYNGLLCQPQDSEDLYEKMKNILSLDRERLVKMGENGRKLVLEKFDDRFIIDFYTKALARYMTPSPAVSQRKTDFTLAKDSPGV
jgi:glycosyltransferase involved in cell wall biosynthesis